MVHCSAYNCFVDSRKRKSKKDLVVCSEDAAATLDGPSHPTQIKTLFVFPTNHALQKIWILKMNLIIFEVKPHSRLCQDHFEEDQFEVNPKFIAFLGLERIKGPTLKSDAVPTIFDRGPKKPSPKKRYGAFLKHRRLKTISELLRGPSVPDPANEPREIDTYMSDIAEKQLLNKESLSVQDRFTELTSCANELYLMQEQRPPLTGDSWPHKQLPDL
eukprot:gene16143-7505_t